MEKNNNADGGGNNRIQFGILALMYKRGIFLKV